MFLLYYYCTIGTLWHLQKCLHYIVVEFTPHHHSPLCILPPFLEEFQQVSLFHFHTWLPNISTTFTPYTPSFYLPPPTCTNPQTEPILPSFSSFLKKRHFYMVKTATQEVSLWHFCVYMYYIPNWFFPSIYLLSTLVPFLWWFQHI
jgi:hypothetical protein